MDDDNSRKRRRRFFSDFDDMFDDDVFGFDFDRIHEHMNRLMKDAFKEFEDIEVEPGKSYVYGFNMRTGPDGKPHVEEFGNVPRQGMQEIPGEREPLVDVIDGKEEIAIIAELPGVDKKDIDLNAGDKSLTIDVGGEGKRYHKDLRLPAYVDPDSVKATYKNGVLSVKLKRKEKKIQAKKKVEIE